MKNNLYLLLGSIGVFLLGCSSLNVTPVYTPLPEQVDKSPFTGVPCEAPCWYGLEVGKSTENEVISTVSTLTFIDQKTIQMNRRPSVPDYFIEEYGPGLEIIGNCVNINKDCLEITVSNDLLQQIIMSLNYEIMAEEAIGQLGMPDYVAVAPVGGEIYICDIYLIWNSSGLVLASTFRADDNSDGVRKYCYVVRDTGKVPANLLISEVRYLSKAELDALITGTGTFFEFTGTIPDK